jgi:ring-1,2-phenylacetyl-CoA epoxidase subunit PaaC
MAATDADSIDSASELTDRQQDAVESLLFRLADDEFVAAERYTDWQVRSPTLESDLALANIAQDEYGHARLWYDLLEDFGYTESELLFEREPESFRHATLVELPFEEGDWADAIVRTYLYDVAEDLRLEALADSSYRRITDRIGKIVDEEDYHLDHAESWLERLADDEEGQTNLQEAVDRLFPHALTLFEPTDHEDEIVEFGFRPVPLDELAEEWLERVVPRLDSLGLRTPVPEDGTVTDELLPPVHGRDGSHTEHWPDLHDEFTHTYRELGRTEATTIMADPDDE